MSAVNHSQTSKKALQNGSTTNVGGVSGSSGNTPAQTPNANGNMAPQQQQQQVPPPSQSTSPPTNNAPKYGTLVPNRVFVGGISANTTEGELAQLFSAYGTVKATKIISDRAGVSKGYGFVTFESEEEAKRLQRESENIMLRERRLNIAPAIKKQPFNRSFDMPSPPPSAATQAQFYYATAAAAAAAAAGGGVPYAAAYQNGMAYYATQPQTTANGADPNAPAQQPVYQAPPVYATPTAAPPAAPYPMPMYPPQPLFVHQQYPYQPIPYDPQQFYGGGGPGLGGPAQYMYGNGTNGNGGGGSGSGAVGAGGPQQQQPGGGGSTGGAGGNGQMPIASSSSGSVGTAGPVNSAATGNSVSPTRHHHHHHQHQHAPHAGYYQHLAYNTPDGMYYNLPVYTIDPSAGIYTEGIDTSIAGMTEASHPAAIEHSLSGAQTVTVSSSVTPPTGPSTGALPKHHHLNHLTQQQQQSQSQPQQQQQQQQQQPYVAYNCIPVSERNGYSQPDKTTPVVSLLSVGQGSERDYRSMQGGRKQRVDKSHQHQHQHQEVVSGAVNGIQSFRIAGQPMAYMYPPVNGYMTKQHHRRSDKCDSNQCRTWAKKRRSYTNCNTESSSMSSLRTSSNSSANAVFDENLNEKKDKANECSPPPAPYSPITTHQNVISSQPLSDNPRNIFQNHAALHNPASYYHHHHNPNQSSSGSSGRRNRRNNTRRNNQQHAHAPASSNSQPTEIGAGDAPLPAEVNDMCKKMDTIKL